MSMLWRSWWRRASAAAAAAAGALGVGACDDVVVNAPVGPQRYADGDLQYASRNGEIETVVAGNPFGASGDTGFAAAVVGHMAGANRGPPVRFVLAPERGGSAPYRIVMAFNPDPNLTADQACARAASLPTGRSGLAITLFAVFCNGETALAEATGRVRGASGAEDRRFRSLVRQVTYALIPPYDFRGPS